MSPTLSSLGEFALVRRFQKQLGPLSSKNIIVGIGDDTSVFRLRSNYYQLLTHDLLLEKVHFLGGRLGDFEDLGWKALAVNLSDIAAMGGIPLQALIGLGLPKHAKLSEVMALYRGLKLCSKTFACPITGGDTNLSKTGWVIAITVLGCSNQHPLLRNGAKIGDSVWVTGTLGGAALGWEAFKKKDHSSTTALFRRQHARPTPRLQWGRQLLASGYVSAMIDVSDGIGGDLQRLAEASKVGFEVETENIPRPSGFSKVCRKFRISENVLLLSGGEDYELLFTVKQGKEKPFRQWLQRHGVQASLVGQAVTREGVRFYEKGKVLKKVKGFAHF